MAKFTCLLDGTSFTEANNQNQFFEGSEDKAIAFFINAYGKDLHSVYLMGSRGNSSRIWKAQKSDKSGLIVNIPQIESPLTQFRAVYFHYEKSGPSNTPHIVHQNDLQKFIQASRDVHDYEGAINPLTGTKPDKILAISVSSFKEAGPYWWTTPGARGGDAGVKIYDPSSFTAATVWMRDDYAKEVENSFED